MVGMPCLMHVVRQMSFWYMFVNDQAVCFCFVNLCTSFQAWKNISVLVHRHIKALVRPFHFSRNGNGLLDTHCSQDVKDVRVNILARDSGSFELSASPVPSIYMGTRHCGRRNSL